MRPVKSGGSYDELDEFNFGVGRSQYNQYGNSACGGSTEIPNPSPQAHFRADRGTLASRSPKQLLIRISMRRMT